MPDCSPMASPRGGDVIYRHRRSTRAWHWVNALTVFVMLMSGMMIFNAHPRLYWGKYGKWTGVPLKLLLDSAGVRPNTRYIVFHCADDFDDTPYYESIDLIDAYHPQTILAWGMNDQLLPIGHGAPLHLRLERQLGYKMAKFVMRVEAVDSLAHIGQGNGGYWEDSAAYQWFAGI